MRKHLYFFIALLLFVSSLGLSSTAFAANRHPWETWKKRVHLNLAKLVRSQFSFDTTENVSLKARKHKRNHRSFGMANLGINSHANTYSGSLYSKKKGSARGSYTLSITRSPGPDGVHGHFIAPSGEIFEISGTTQRTTLTKVDDTLQPPCGDDSSQHVSLPNGSPSAGHDGVSALTTSTVKMLVVYTQSAKTAAGGTASMLSTISSMISYANTAYTNSGIDITLELTGTAELDTDETGYTFNQILNHITYSDGVWDNVHTLRTDFGADAVSVIVSNGGYCGLGWVMDTVSSDFAPYAYNAVNYGCTSSFAHELGHNMGATHDVANSSNPGAYAYSYGWRWTGLSSTQWRTVMAYAPGTRVQYFSNPSVMYDSVATGSAGAADNAQTLNNTRTTFAAFVDDPVSTPTPTPTGTLSPTPTATATATHTATPTPTAIPPEATATPVVTETPTPTSIPALALSGSISCTSKMREGVIKVKAMNGDGTTASGVSVTVMRGSKVLKRFQTRSTTRKITFTNNKTAKVIASIENGANTISRNCKKHS